MMYKNILLAIVGSFLLLFASCEPKQENMLLHSEYVNWEGEEAKTVFVNATGDSLRLAGRFFNYVPYEETLFDVNLAPAEEHTLSLNFQYPEFILFDNQPIKILNAPGRTIRCEIKSLKDRDCEINFTGDFAAINRYYLAYHNELGTQQEGMPYYNAGDRLKDLNDFPAVADSITQVSLDFLKTYEKPLPDWFRKHESWRHKYNAAARKHNVPMSREFYTGKKPELEQEYFDFEKKRPFDNEEMIFNTEYFWYIKFYVGRKVKEIVDGREFTPAQWITTALKVIDTLNPQPQTADILKMRFLTQHCAKYPVSYDSLIQQTTFADPTNKTLLNRLLAEKEQKPMEGKKAPDFTLEDINGENVTFSDFSNQLVILNFWATWCKPCLKEFPHENELAEKYKNKGLTLINVCVDSKEANWRRLSEKFDLKMVNLFADKQQVEQLREYYEFSALPRSLLIKPGLIVEDNYLQRVSKFSDKQIDEMLEKYQGVAVAQE